MTEQELRARIARLEAQLELSANAWKAWEGTIRERDAEIARLEAECQAYRRGSEQMPDKISDLALVIEMSGRLHIVTALSDPTTATRRVYCSCGWKSEREKFDKKKWESFEVLAKETREHLIDAKLLEARADPDFHQRWDRYNRETASDFIQGKRHDD